mmetsp:Transcript_105388/g.235213  ORF Transcript_105388/g.235213 Transcript_105388/m.235213 type:complete len:205 (+) Transcript_105388:2-616(+)
MARRMKSSGAFWRSSARSRRSWPMRPAFWRSSAVSSGRFRRKLQPLPETQPRPVPLVQLASGAVQTRSGTGFWRSGTAKKKRMSEGGRRSSRRRSDGGCRKMRPGSVGNLVRSGSSGRRRQPVGGRLRRRQQRRKCVKRSWRERRHVGSKSRRPRRGSCARRPSAATMKRRPQGDRGRSWPSSSKRSCRPSRIRSGMRDGSRTR